MMIRPFLYDFRRTITSKSVLILTGIILLISLAIIPFTAPVVSSFGGSSSPDILYYRDPGAYHFIVFSSDQYSQPVQGTEISMKLSGTQTQTYANSSTTNSAGYAFITLSAPNGTYYWTVNATRGGSSSSLSTYLYSSPPIGQPQFQYTSWISTVQDRANASKSDVRTFYAGLYGAKPLGYSIRYKVAATPPLPPYKDDTPYTEGQMDLLGNLTDYRQVFDPAIPNGLSETTRVYFELFASNGTAVSGRQMFVTDLRHQQFRPEATNVASFFFSTILSFFMPLAAILGAYSSYGKDRLTGVLESGPCGRGNSLRWNSRPATKPGLRIRSAPRLCSGHNLWASSRGSCFHWADLPTIPPRQVYRGSARDQHRALCRLGLFLGSDSLLADTSPGRDFRIGCGSGSDTCLLLC